MNGRLEKEIKAERAMDVKLDGLPQIFRSYYLFLRAERKTYSTLAVYINNVIHFAKFVTGGNITNDFYRGVTVGDVEGYIVSLETTVKNGHVARTGSDILCSRWSSINTFFEFLKKRGYIESNPVSMTTRPKNTTQHEVTYLNKKEVKSLLAAAGNHPNKVMAQRNETLLSLAISSGMRCSAIVNINIEDIDFDGLTISTVEKGNKIRKITFGPSISGVLRKWIEVRKQMSGADKTGALFLSQKGERISVGAVNNMIKAVAEQAGIRKKLTCHKMRSTMACAALDANVPLLSISQRLGHSNLSTTQRYLAARDEDRAKLTLFLDNLI